MEKNNDSRNELIEALGEAARGKNRTKKARLAEILDQIEYIKTQGLSRKEIVKVLASQQLVMSEATYATTLSRIQKEKNSFKKQTKKEGVALPHEPKLALETESRSLNISAEVLKIKVGTEKVTGCDEVVEVFNEKQNTSKYDTD